MTVNAVFNCFDVLKAFLGAERSLPLKAVSQAAGMPASKTHRYLQSLVKCGLVVQDRQNGRYALGPGAVQLGLAGLSRIDPVRNACREAARMAWEFDVGVAVSVFSPQGPVVVAYEEPSATVQPPILVGSRMTWLASAPGQVFLAHLPRARAVNLVMATIAAGCRHAVDIDGLAHRVRQRGYAEAPEGAASGTGCIAAPVFDAVHAVGAVVAFASPKPDLTDPKRRYVGALLAETRALSLAERHPYRAAM